MIAAYVRVSTDKQSEKGISLEAQTERIAAHAKYLGFSEVKQYLDVGSARKMERSSFKSLFEDIENGLVDHLIIYRLDRLTRSIADLNKIVDFLEKNNCTLHSVTEQLDTSSANGRMVINIIGTIAQWESDITAERVRENMQHLASQGRWMMAVPYGYKLGEDKRLEIIPEERDVILETVDLIITKGYSFTRAGNAMSEKYNLSWRNGKLAEFLFQEFLYGNIYRNGEIYKNTHPAILDQETKSILEQKVKRTPKSYTASEDIFRQKIACPSCKKIMYAGSYKRKNERHHRYVCDSCGISINESRIDDAFIDYIQSLDVDFDVLKPTQRETVDNSDEIKKIKNKIDRINRAWIADLMSDEEFEKYKKELEGQLEELENTSSENAPKGTEIDFLNFVDIYTNLDRESKRDVVQSLIQTVYVNRVELEGMPRNKRYVISINHIEYY